MRGRSDSHGHLMPVWQILLGVTFLSIWEAGARSGWLDRFYFSRPSDVALRVWEWTVTGSVWPHLGTTLLDLPARLSASQTGARAQPDHRTQSSGAFL